jgi:putative ABC transport system permease protein
LFSRGSWARDLEIVSRRLINKPLFLIAVLCTLTVGLGAFAVVYTAVDKILLNPLPYSYPEDLYMVWENAKNDSSVITGPVIADLQKTAGPIEAAAGMRRTPITLPAEPDRDAARITGLQVSSNFFDLLGVHPSLGRGFRPEETGPKSADVIVLSNQLWKRFGSNEAIIGTELRVGTAPFTVIGVMPQDFEFSAPWAQQPDAYIPLYDDLAAQPTWAHDYRALVRARHGSSAEQVRQALEAAARLTDSGDTHQGILRKFYPVGFQADIVESVRPALLALSFAVVFLVLVLTVNLASLLLARASEREREVAVSRALGATGSAVVGPIVTEGALLGLIGGIMGALAGTWGTRILVALGPEDLPRREILALDWSVALVVAAVGLALGIAAASLPALWVARTSLASLLSGTAVRGAASSSRMRRGLVVVQVALSLVLLSAGGLVVRTFERLVRVDPGFISKGVLVFNVGLGNWLFPKDPESYAFQDRATEALRALPGVTGVGATTTVPLGGGTNVIAVTAPGAPGNTGDANEDEAVVDRIFVRSGYLETIGIRLLGGRTFEAARTDGVREAVIDQHLAKKFFPGGNPIGATLRSDDVPMTIIGVVEQARIYDLHQDGRPQLFVRADDYENRRPSYFAVHTNGDLGALVSEVRGTIRQVDRRVAVSQLLTMDSIVADHRSRERISAVLISGLALGALLLVAVGLFGLISGSVTRRSGELAVRLALGATHGRVIKLVVGEGARLIALGLLIGIPGIYMAGRALEGFLIGVSPTDTPTFIAVALGLVVIALLACYLAARRISAIEPSRLLREGG